MYEILSTPVTLIYVIYITLVASAPVGDNGFAGGHVGSPAIEVMYQVGEISTFTCGDPSNTNSVNWFIEGHPITDDTRDELDTWFIHSVDVHQNTISLVAQANSGPVSTLLCKIAGPYPENIVKIYHLIKAVNKAPSDEILGRHARQQECPLYTDDALTLNCEPGLRFIQPIRWVWFKDDVPIGGETSAHIRVTEPGVYRCMYFKHKHLARDLLEFNVERTSGSHTTEKNWTFCSYTH